MVRVFRNRKDAGKVLAEYLSNYQNREGLLVLGLPRGGVPVASEVAEALGAELDVFVVRKLGTPGHKELAMGAVASGGTRVINNEVVGYLHIPPDAIEQETQRENQEVHKREELYRQGQTPAQVEGRPVILVDDGLATGASMLAAIQALRHKHPASITIAVPVAAPTVRDNFENEVDEIVCAQTPSTFSAVGTWYEDFSPVSDEEVVSLLESYRQPQHDLGEP